MMEANRKKVIQWFPRHLLLVHGRVARSTVDYALSVDCWIHHNVRERDRAILVIGPHHLTPVVACYTHYWISRASQEIECGVTSAVSLDDHECRPRTPEQCYPFLRLTIVLVPEPSISHLLIKQV